MTLHRALRPAVLAATVASIVGAIVAAVVGGPGSFGSTTDLVFVSVPADGTVAMVDREQMVHWAGMSVGERPGALAITRDNSRLLVVDFGEPRLHVVALGSYSIDASIPFDDLRHRLRDVAVAPDGRTAYVSTRSAGTVWIVNLETLSSDGQVMVPSVSSGTRLESIAVTPDGSKAFVVDSGEDRLHTLLTATRSFVGEGTDLQIGAVEVAVCDDGAHGIAVGQGGPAFFSTATSEVTSRGADRGTHLDVTVVGDRAYVTNAGTVTVTQKGPRSAPIEGQAAIDVYDVSTGEHLVSHALPEGTWPQGVTARDDAHVYPCMEDDGTGHLLAVDGTSGATGATAGVGSVPWRAAVWRSAAPPPDETPVVSCFLPRAVNFVAKGPGRDVFSAAGAFDDGGLPVDWTKPVKLSVGGYAREFTLVPNRRGTAYTFTDEGLGLTLTPRIRGSSKGRFRLRIRRTTLEGLVPTDDTVRLAFSATGLPDMAGAVKLTKGRYRIARRRGALVEPVLFTAFGKFTLGTKGDGTDSAVLRCGLATNGVTPAALGTVRVAFGDFDTWIAGEEFVRKGDTFRTVVSVLDSKIVVSIDFLREVVTVTLKNVELGPLAPGQVVDVVLDPGTGVGACRNRVRLGNQGKKLFY